jgi:hypothetical protein
MQPSTRQPRKWTSVEDQTLREEVEAQRECHPFPLSRSNTWLFFHAMVISYSRSLVLTGLSTVIGGGEVKDWYDHTTMQLTYLDRTRLTRFTGAESLHIFRGERTKTVVSVGTIQWREA